MQRYHVDKVAKLVSDARGAVQFLFEEKASLLSKKNEPGLAPLLKTAAERKLAILEGKLKLAKDRLQQVEEEASQHGERMRKLVSIQNVQHAKLLFKMATELKYAGAIITSPAALALGGGAAKAAAAAAAAAQRKESGEDAEEGGAAGGGAMEEEGAAAAATSSSSSSSSAAFLAEGPALTAEELAALTTPLLVGRGAAEGPMASTLTALNPVAYNNLRICGGCGTHYSKRSAQLIICSSCGRDFCGIGGRGITSPDGLPCLGVLQCDFCSHKLCYDCHMGSHSRKWAKWSECVMCSKTMCPKEWQSKSAECLGCKLEPVCRGCRPEHEIDCDEKGGFLAEKIPFKKTGGAGGKTTGGRRGGAAAAAGGGYEDEDEDQDDRDDEEEDEESGASDAGAEDGDGEAAEAAGERSGKKGASSGKSKSRGGR